MTVLGLDMCLTCTRIFYFEFVLVYVYFSPGEPSTGLPEMVAEPAVVEDSLGSVCLMNFD